MPVKKSISNKKNNHLIAAKKKAPVSKKIQTVKATNTGPPFYAICIGASAGGLNAVSELLSQLPKEINAAVFIVLHLSKAALGDILVSRINKSTTLPCKIAVSEEPVKAGHVYIAPPDVHLLVKNGNIIIGRGPVENRFRPSIDVLFRSAAASYGQRAIGVVLTGFLNDGTSGMWAIKQSGGHTIVQDPNEAEYPDMPLSVLESMEADHAVSLKKMGGIITDILKQTQVKNVVPPEIIRAESKLSEKAATGIDTVKELGKQTIYACPDCGGGLWKINNGRMGHYRCHIGHSYSETDLVLQQGQTLEHTLWVAVRMMEERKTLFKKVAKENSDRGLEKMNTSYLEQAGQLVTHIEKLKELLFMVNKD